MSEFTANIFDVLGKEKHPANQHHWESKSKYWLCNRLIELAKQFEQLEDENKEKTRLIGLLCSEEPCPKCGYGVTGACYGCEIKRLKADIEQRKDYESYLQSTKEPTYSYVSWQKQQALKANQ